jgi:hypothetical protein
MLSLFTARGSNINYLSQKKGSDLQGAVRKKHIDLVHIFLEYAANMVIINGGSVSLCLQYCSIESSLSKRCSRVALTKTTLGPDQT